MVFTIFSLALLVFIGCGVFLYVSKKRKKKQILANRKKANDSVETTTAGTEITDD